MYKLARAGPYGAACILGLSLFLGFGLVAWAATRGARNVRRAYITALMAQDVKFFDAAQAGELSAASSEKVQELQNGCAKKLGELIQALFTGVGGLSVGFYFSWKLSLVILAGVPLLAGREWRITPFLSRVCGSLNSRNEGFRGRGGAHKKKI